MAFIHLIAPDAAEDETAAMYDRAKEGFGYIPNLVKAFSHRPEVMDGWNDLLDSIKAHMDVRRYELVTIAAAKELNSSYCMVAHGSILLRDHFDAGELQAIIDSPQNSPLDDADRAIMRFTAKVVRDASSIEQANVDELREHGLSDAEIFDVAAAAAVRCFFSKTLDALGVQPDASYNSMDTGLQDTLVVGRPIEK